MEKLKVTLDRIEDDTAVLLVRDEEATKIDIPLFYCLLKVGKGISWILSLPKIHRKQRMLKKESRVYLKSLRKNRDGMKDVGIFKF